MFKKLGLTALGLSAALMLGSTTIFADHVQSAHLTTSQGWSNDLQSITYNSAGNYYDVYFLHSVQGATNVFGDQGQNWVHTTTKDFVHYTEQNSAIPAKGGDSKEGWTSAWTGSIITNNGQISGVPKGAKVAYFTGLRKSDGKQNLYAAYSTDNGKTFTKALNNGKPILDVSNSYNQSDFRDENVFYWNNKLYMYVAEGDVIGVYTSTNGVNWTKADQNGASKIMSYTFFAGRSWDGNAPVECPIIETMTTTDGKQKQVLFFGAKDASKGETTGTYYIVGHLDNNGLFVNETEVKRLDQGSDYYGANFTGTDSLNQTNSTLTTLGWVGNWNYFTNGVHDDQAATSAYASRLGSYSSARTLKLQSDLTLKQTLRLSGYKNPKTTSATTTKPATVYGQASLGRDTNGEIQVLVDKANQSATKYYNLTFRNTSGNYNGRIYINIWQGSDYVQFNYDSTNGWYNVKQYSAELNNSLRGQADSSYYYDGLLGNGNGYSADSGLKNQKSINLKVVTDNNSVEFVFPNGQTYTVSRFNTSGKQDFKIYTEDPTGTNRVTMTEYDF